MFAPCCTRPCPRTATRGRSPPSPTCSAEAEGRTPSSRRGTGWGQSVAGLSAGRASHRLCSTAHAPLAPRGHEVRGHAHRASGLSEDGDAPRVAAEGRRVLPHPAHGLALVLNGVVAAERRGGEEAQGAQAARGRRSARWRACERAPFAAPILNGHHHDAILAREEARVVERRVDPALLEPPLRSGGSGSVGRGAPQFGRRRQRTP